MSYKSTIRDKIFNDIHFYSSSNAHSHVRTN